jgi:predicted enzyme related to lactoylglutathione lyase
MANRTAYRPGTPNWVDLQTTDQDGAKSFYGNLFGWKFDDRPMPRGPVYSMAVHNGGVVAAIAPGQAPVWNTYFAVEDIDAATARIEPAGGKVLTPPFPVMDAGRMCFAADPAGATFALWQADRHIGATVVNEPGALIWNELLSADPDHSLPFYGQVLGIEARIADMAGRPYPRLFIDGVPVAGAAAGTPSRWHVYFDVVDTADTARRAAELGGEVVDGPYDTPIGAIATLRDPQGGVFGVIAHHAPES